MQQLLRREFGGRVAVAIATERADGDMHPERVDAGLLQQRQIAVTGSTWVMLDEMHGTNVVAADAHLPWPLAGAGDVPRAVAAGLARRGIALNTAGPCTGCDQRFRSHRRRAELERHALVAWFEEAP